MLVPPPFLRSYPVLSQCLYKKNKNLFQCILSDLHILLFGHFDYSGTSLRRRVISSSLKHVTVCLFSCAYNSMPCIQWVLFKYLLKSDSTTISRQLDCTPVKQLLKTGEKQCSEIYREIIPHSGHAIIQWGC